jgi:Xaa-Pro dipeptidase
MKEHWIMPHIAEGEYQDRLYRLRAEVAKEGVDRFLVTSFDSIYYLTGAGFEPLERPFFLIVPPPGTEEASLLVPRLDAEHMRKAHGIGTIHTYWDCPSPKGRGWADVLTGLLGKARRIGVEPSLRGDIVEALRELSPDALPLVERLRLVKSPGEVAMIRQAAHYAEWAVGQLLGASYPGAAVAEGFARTGAVTRKIIREVEDWEILTTRVLMATWAAPRSARPHSIPALGDRLRGGPHVALALLRVNGYAAESERTYFTTSPTAEMRRAYRAMLEARSIAFRMIRPGVACSEIDGAVGDFLKAEGYGGEARRLHRAGHGIGLGNHEAPWIAVGSDEILAENMVISIEPGIYLEGELPGGFRHSDTVLVTGGGSECLTRLPADLESLDQRGWKPVARFRGLLVRRALRVDRDREPRAKPMGTRPPSPASGNPSGVDRGTPCPEANPRRPERPAPGVRPRKDP